MKRPIEAPKMVDNVGDPEQVARGKTKADIIERRQRDRWANLLDDEDARLVLWEIIEETRAFHSAFGASDAETNHNTGRQDIGHFILARVHEARPKALIEMMLDNAKEKSL